MSTFILILFKKQNFHREKNTFVLFHSFRKEKKTYPMQNKKIFSRD